jgi:hypothetical protein
VLDLIQLDLFIEDDLLEFAVVVEQLLLVEEPAATDSAQDGLRGGDRARLQLIQIIIVLGHIVMAHHHRRSVSTTLRSGTRQNGSAHGYPRRSHSSSHREEIARF